MHKQYSEYKPNLDKALVNELSLEVTNGSKAFKDYDPHPSQIKMVFDRVRREIKNKMEETD